MGKATIIFAAAATMTLTTMLVGVQRSSFEANRITANYEEEVLAREIATSALSAAVSRVRRDYDNERPAQDVTPYQQGTFESFASGAAAGPVDITATGKYGKATYTIETNLSRLSSLPSTVVIDSDTVDVSMTGDDFLISGKDTRPTDEPDQIPEGSGWGTPVGGVWTRTNGVMKSFMAPLTGDLIDNVRGQEDQANVINAKIPIDLDVLYQEALTVADQTFDGDQVFSDMVFGSPSYPAVVVVHGSATLADNVEGYGLLIAEGNFTARSNARWNGLILVNGEGDVYVSHEDESLLFGGIVIRHKHGEFDGSGDDGSGDDGSGDDGSGGDDSGDDLPSGALHFNMQDKARIFYSTETLGKLAARLPSLKSVSWIVSHDQWSGKGSN